MTKVCEGMFVDVREVEAGFEVWMENTTTDLYDCTLNFSKSKNLSMEMVDSKVKVAEPMVATFTAKAGSKAVYVKLPVVDKSVGPGKCHYEFKGGKNMAAIDAKEKALDDARKGADAEAAAKKKAKEDEEKLKTLKKTAEAKRVAAELTMQKNIQLRKLLKDRHAAEDVANRKKTHIFHQARFECLARAGQCTEAAADASSEQK